MTTEGRIRREYERKPLVEAIFELFADPEHSTLWLPQSLSKIGATFPEYGADGEEHIQDLGVQLKVGPDGVLTHTTQARLGRTRRWNQGHTKAIQFGSHMCAHNVLADAYVHFDDHAPTVRDVLRAYLEEARPQRIGWIGQRYINLIKIPATEIDVVKYFEIYPRLPAPLSGGHRPIAIQVQTLDFKNGSVTVNLTFQGIQEQDAHYVLDVYARSSSDVPVDAEALLRWHEAAHVAVSDSFELSVSDKSRAELFKERK